MTSDLERLLRLYEALQDCQPQDQAVHQKNFRLAVKEVAGKHHLLHWDVSAHVVRQWDQKCRADDKRKGLDRGAGLA